MIVHRPTPCSLAALAAMALTSGACDPMTDDSYHGTALFTLSGKIANRRQVTPADVQLYLLWNAPNGGDPNVAEQLEIEPSFPATFRLNVFTPPPVLGPWDEPGPPPPWWSRLTMGHIVAATSDARFTEYMSYPTNHRDPGIVGVDPRHAIYYMPDALPGDSFLGKFFHGAVAPGFHVFDLKCISPAKRAEMAACLAQYRAEGRPDDLGEMTAACNGVNPDFPWLGPARDDLQTELTVELIDDLSSWRPDPAECL